MDESLSIIVQDEDLSAATVLAQELESAVREVAPGSEPRLERADELNQDWGDILNLVLEPSAVGAIAAGIANWLSRRSSARLVLTRVGGDGTKTKAEVHGQLGARAEKVIRDFLSH